MALFTRSILCTPAISDGLRISVMSRHTLNDGRTLDKRIVLKFGLYHMHWPILGPRPKLVGSLKRGEILWDEFEEEYLNDIRSPGKIYFVNMIADLARVMNVTLLCVEDTPEHCHRRILAEECQRLKPNLIVKHR